MERSRLATIAFSGSYFGTVISLPFSSLLANAFGWDSIFYVFDTLEFELGKAGFLSALPYLAMTIVLQSAGCLADYLRTLSLRARKDSVASYLLSTTGVRKMFNCGAFISQTIFMLLAAHSPTAGGAVAFLTLAVGLGGFVWSGFSVNHLDIAPQHASVLMGLSNTVATLPGIISPSITGYIVQNKAAAEWKIVFYIASAIYLAGAVFYGTFASGELQPWAEVAEPPQTCKNEDDKSRAADSDLCHSNQVFEGTP